MEPTAITVVSRLITDARTRFGASNVEAVAVAGSLVDETMAHVLEAGGEVSMDASVVDGVEVRALPEGQTTPLAYLVDSDEPKPLTS